MKTAEILLNIRNKNRLTQEQMAGRLFVTRQAVSRWENGETMPNIDALKLISAEFGILIDNLPGADRNKVCQCCTYPLNNLDELGTNADGTWNTDYCIYCYKDGDWVDPNLTIQGVVDYTIPFTISPSMFVDEARAKLEEWIPTLKRWQAV
jgi:transcriptional regulator with XRE-family HTH domain